MNVENLNIEHKHYNHIIRHGSIDQETLCKLNKYVATSNVARILLYGEGTTAKAIRENFAGKIVGSVDSASVQKINDSDFDVLFLALSPAHYNKILYLIQSKVQKTIQVLRIFQPPPQGHNIHTFNLEKRRNENIQAFREKYLSSKTEEPYQQDADYILKKIDALSKETAYAPVLVSFPL